MVQHLLVCSQTPQLCQLRTCSASSSKRHPSYCRPALCASWLTGRMCAERPPYPHGAMPEGLCPGLSASADWAALNQAAGFPPHYFTVRSWQLAKWIRLGGNRVGHGHWSACSAAATSARRLGLMLLLIDAAERVRQQLWHVRYQHQA